MRAHHPIITCLAGYYIKYAEWPRGQAVKTAASHAVNVGSIPAGVTIQQKNSIVGVDCLEGPPVPIPNTVVKLKCADNSMRVTACEDR